MISRDATRTLFGGVAALVLCGLGCTTRGNFAGGMADYPPLGDGGAPVEVTVSMASANALRESVAADRPADASGFHARWPTKYLTALPYDPLAATNLDLIAGSSLGLNDAERQLIARNGFVISARQSFPTFLYGYKSIYADHLPVYISLDSVLHAVHRSYDGALMRIEFANLIPSLGTLLANMHAALGAGAGDDFPPEVRKDIDVYLTVARRLLGQMASPVVGGSSAIINDVMNKAAAATDVAEAELFGKKRLVDFTQFKPRGHYENNPQLQTYFRSMMWLGRTDLRFLVFDPFAAPDAPPTFHRREFLGGLLLAELTQGADLDRWHGVDEVLRGFVGESDNMTVADFPKLRQNLGVSTALKLAALPDQVLAQALLDGGFGLQRIASQILFGGNGVPLDRVFLFFGQRFVVDSQVFSEVVYDRIPSRRMLPNPLDVAFSALGNNAAAPLLDGEMRMYNGYLGKLHDTRRLVDGHGDDFWGGSLYATWLSALRGVAAPGGDPTTIAGLPSVMKTEAWARRLLNTQLGSWAELRHDTLLYAKQSYTTSPVCIFPDAYVDPYPEAWAGIVRLARLGQALSASVPGTAVEPALAAYFAEVETVTTMLQAMAEAERAGRPFSGEQMAFINQAVDLVFDSSGSGGVQHPRGWYARLFLVPDDSKTSDPTIADVHSNPDFKSTPQILHVATGFPRLMVVTADTCNGPRAYAGLVSSYFEHIPDTYRRVTDMEWYNQITQTPPPDVAWMANLISQ